jgi:hypothetical protein
MKYYELEYYYQDVTEWCQVKKTIRNKTIFSLIKTFIKETNPIVWLGENKTKREVVRIIWNEYKNSITEETIQFPYVDVKKV